MQYFAKSESSNGLIVVKLKRDLKYCGYDCFESVRPNVIYQQALNYLKTHNNLYLWISMISMISMRISMMISMIFMRIFPFQKISN